MGGEEMNRWYLKWCCSRTVPTVYLDAGVHSTTRTTEQPTFSKSQAAIIFHPCNLQLLPN